MLYKKKSYLLQLSLRVSQDLLEVHTHENRCGVLSRTQLAMLHLDQKLVVWVFWNDLNNVGRYV